jgi:3-dehydroquinate dehydratase II
MKLIIINGPNLNLTGTREKDIYGSETFEELMEKLRKEFPEINLEYFQSNIEGEIINKLHETGFSYDGIIINPGGYSHTSVAIADAIAAIKTPVAEVHITNIYARENYRHQSLTGAKCKGVISGFGLRGYGLAVNYFINS